ERGSRLGSDATRRRSEVRSYGRPACRARVRQSDPGVIARVERRQPTQGSCDVGDCFYMNTVSWRNETTPNLTEMNPRVIFHRLFGDGGDSAQRLMQMKKTDSIL